MADHIESYSAAELEALAARKRCAEQADVVDIAQGRKPKPKPASAWPTEATIGNRTFALQPDLGDDFEFLAMIMEFNDLSRAGDGFGIARAAENIISYAYVEPYDEIMAALKALHPEDERAHVHNEDISALVQGTCPKA